MCTRRNFSNTDCHEGIEVHGYDVNAGKFNGFHRTPHYQQNGPLNVVIQRCPIASEYHIGKFQTLWNEEEEEKKIIIMCHIRIFHLAITNLELDFVAEPTIIKYLH